MSRNRRAADHQAALNLLQQYTLQGIQETGVELGRGSYAVVYTVEYKGLKCAAKNFHRELYQQEYSIHRFQEECAILSQLRHPNIVQFLGVYYQPGSILPALVMEYLPMTLAQCLDQYGVLPNEIGYSILKDVALALSYLHQHDPPIIHRDLSANNVLLTHGMMAKISDLGVAKMLDLSHTQMYTMTTGPGTPCYMPPEALEENAYYNCKVDAFSCGVLMVHLFSGQWPIPTKPVIVDPQDDSQVIPQTEADRRQEKLDAIGSDHPLMNLILDCLHNSPTRRPEAVEILRQVSRVAAQFLSSSVNNKVMLLQQVTSLRANTTLLQQANETLRADTERLQQANNTLRADTERLQQANETLRADKERLQEANQSMKAADTERLQEANQLLIKKEHSLSEKDRLLNQLMEQQTELGVFLQSKEAILSAKESLVASKDSTICHLQQELDHLRKSHTAQVSRIRM